MAIKADDFIFKGMTEVRKEKKSVGCWKEKKEEGGKYIDLRLVFFFFGPDWRQAPNPRQRS